jgi:hypothetical protein
MGKQGLEDLIPRTSHRRAHRGGEMRRRAQSGEGTRHHLNREMRGGRCDEEVAKRVREVHLARQQHAIPHPQRQQHRNSHERHPKSREPSHLVASNVPTDHREEEARRQDDGPLADQEIRVDSTQLLVQERDQSIWVISRQARGGDIGGSRMERIGWRGRREPMKWGSGRRGGGGGGGGESEGHKSTDQHQPRTQAHTDAQGDVATQHRTAQAEREEQDEIVDDAGDDLVRFDQPLLLDLGLPPLASWIVSLKDQRPTDTEEEVLQPQRRVVRIAGEDDDHLNEHCEHLKSDGVHVHRDVRSEKS